MMTKSQSMIAGAVALLAVLTLVGCAGSKAAEHEETEASGHLFGLSDDTRRTFSFTPTNLDSVQFFLDGTVAYVATTVSNDRKEVVASGAPQVAERRHVRKHRIEIKPGTPGRVVGGDFKNASWSYVYVDFGGVILQFDAGRAGVGADEEAAPDRRPVLYYAPADELALGGKVYHLDRRSYGGATLSFRGTYQLTHTSESETWVLDGVNVQKDAGVTQTVATTPPVSSSRAVPEEQQRTP